MDSLQDYRTKCYDKFVSTHWNYTHTFSKKAYDHYAKVSRKRFKAILPDDKVAKIIDIACGAGHFLYFLQKEGYGNAKGIDLSSEMVEIARKIGINNVEKADLFEYLSEHLQSFDMVVANDIIEHLSKDEIVKFLDLIHQSLKPEGKVLISTINAQSLLGASIVFIDFTHEIGFTPNSLLQVMRVCGFRDVSIYGEKPIVHDFRSTIRAGLWWSVEKIIKSYVTIADGTGRGLWKRNNIFEKRIFAVGKRL